MNEFQLIEQLTRNLPTNDSVVTGTGDDCAVLDLGLPDRFLLFKTDAVVEGIHFLTTAEPERIGYKALARCLSDIAAMAGTPTHALITIGLPKNFDADFVKRIYSGLGEVAQKYNVAIVGGETTTNPERIFISIALLGTVRKGKCPTRSGAKAGDAIFVTGNLGGSLSGRHLEFEPRLVEAEWLAGNFEIHSMIDLSDGLAGDLRHILQASKVGAELLAAAIPISRAAKLQSRAESSSKPPLLAALTDGEDFELLFTVRSGDAVALLDGWKKEFPKVKLSCIGKIVKTPGLKLRTKEGVRDLGAKGYTHFDKELKKT
ncbi:MAG: thiamine-monophosphate kinase [Verrucomicrobia bacterium]|nr:thiamine-monophosphate kinase [Verrucomicrobiota bacterium]